MPTFRRPDALRESVQAILAQDYPSDRYELIVVDDEGEDTAAAVLAEFGAASSVTVKLESQKRCGAAVARNRGAKVAAAELVLFIDDDMIVAADHLQRHAVAQQMGARTIVGGAWEFSPAVLSSLQTTPFGRYRIDLERRFQQEVFGTELQDGIVEMRRLGAANLAVNRALFWELGGFDDAFPVAGAEDQDFSMRARGAGCQLVMDTKILCLHNDNWLDLASYCAREERSAKTMPVVARKFPAEYDGTEYINENRPIRREDSPALILKKLVKAVLARPRSLRLLHRIVAVCEVGHVPDAVLRRLYSSLLGLHLYRGFRATW